MCIRNVIVFRYSRKVGVKLEKFTESERTDFEFQYLEFLTGEMDLEKFFDISLCMVRLSADNRSLGKLKISRKWYMHISRKPKTWDNLVIIAERGDDLYYVRKHLSELLSKFSPDDAVLPMSPRTLFGIYGCDISEITEESLARLEIDMGKKVRIYTLGENNRIERPSNQVYGAFLDSGDNFINIVVNHRAKLFTPEAQFSLVANPDIIHKCFKCRFFQMIFSRRYDKERHEKCCNEEKTVKTRQKALGDNENELVKLVKSGYLPECFLNYRQKYLITFDIETLETPTDEAVSDFTVKDDSVEIEGF